MHSNNRISFDIMRAMCNNNMVSKSFYYFHFNEMLCDSRLFLTDNRNKLQFLYATRRN